MLRPQMTAPLSRSALLLLLAVAIGMAGCGGDDGRGSGERARGRRRCCSTSRRTPSTPARTSRRQRGYDRKRGRAAAVRAPASGADSVKLLRAGRADLAYMDIHDLALADAEGPRQARRRDGARPAPARGACSPQPDDQAPARPRGPPRRRQRPAERRRRAALDRRAATAATRTRCARSRSASRPCPRCSRGEWPRATGFWNAEGVALQRQAPDLQEFRVDDFGAPQYPELVLVDDAATTLRAGPGARAPARSSRCGAATRRRSKNPPAAIGGADERRPAVSTPTARGASSSRSPALHRRRAALRRPAPARAARSWAAWEKRFGIVDRRPSVSRLFVFDLAGTR